MSINSLTYLNTSGTYYTTLITNGSTVTIAQGITIGSTAPASVAITGAGTLVAGTGGSSTLSLPNTSGTAVLDMSGLANFILNFGNSGGTINLAQAGGGSATLDLAAVSNNVTCGTLSIGNNNTSGSGTLNLGNGTNIINADTISMGISKTSGTMQFLNNAGGGLKIANHTGTGRANITLAGEGSSGSTSASNNGLMLFNGGTVNILAGTLVLGNRGNRNDTGPSANGVLSFTSGTVDATTIDMATNITSGSPGNGTISVGGGKLIIGNGGMNMVAELSSIATLNLGTLIVTNGGSVICSNDIFKGTSKGTATITIDGGTLNMASLGGTIGVDNFNPIDNFNLTNSTMTVAVANYTANISVNNFNPDTATTNTINIGAMPSITVYPTTFPMITYPFFFAKPETPQSRHIWRCGSPARMIMGRCAPYSVPNGPLSSKTRSGLRGLAA